MRHTYLASKWFVGRKSIYSGQIGYTLTYLMASCFCLTVLHYSQFNSPKCWILQMMQLSLGIVYWWLSTCNYYCVPLLIYVNNSCMFLDYVHLLSICTHGVEELLNAPAGHLRIFQPKVFLQRYYCFSLLLL
jgi:hypothetical protein